MNPSAATETPWHDPVGVPPVRTDAATAARDECSLPDDVLLQICRLSADDPQVTPQWLTQMRMVARLLGDQHCCHHTRLEGAMTLLASALGRLAQFNPTHLPFGYEGPQTRWRGWLERRTLERVGKQVVGLIWRDDSAEAIAAAVECAVSEGIRLGFLEQRRYDAWRPGMRSGSGWRWAVTATPYGVARANMLVEDPHLQTLPNGGPGAAATAPRSNGQRSRESHQTASRPGMVARAEHRRSAPAAAAPSAADSQSKATSPASSDDRYEWARQIDLVRATNQVLGEGMLNKGVLSRACADGQGETNGKTGRGARVRVRSFLAWVSRQNELGADETIQIRNAVIGEITARNS